MAMICGTEDTRNNAISHVQTALVLPDMLWDFNVQSLEGNMKVVQQYNRVPMET